MQIKHDNVYDDLYIISRYLDAYYDERMEYASLIIPVYSSLTDDLNDTEYGIAKGICDYFLNLIKINNHECDLLEKMQRYLQLMETNNKLNEYNKKYRVLFFKIIIELGDSLDQRRKASLALTEAAVTGLLNNTTDLAIASNIDFMTPHLSNDQIEAYKEIIPSK